MTAYACADLHGRLDLWEKACNELFKEDDIIYFLGDAADKGKDGYALIKKLLDDKRVIFLKGNHEEMLLNAFVDVTKYQNDNLYLSSVSLLNYNGGNQTLKDFLEDKDRTEIYQRLKSLNKLVTIYINKNHQSFYLSHAGFDFLSPEDDYLWDRQHIYNEDYIAKEKKNEINKEWYFVHGHTPVFNLPDFKSEKIEPLIYCHGHKIDVDCRAYKTGVMGIFDMDNFRILTIEEDAK
jgi:serine/threonine protein phosphatase 1